MEQISTAPKAWWFPCCSHCVLVAWPTGVEQTQHFWHEPFLNLGDANTVSSRPGLWGPAKLFRVFTLLWGQSPGTVHRVPSEMLHGQWGLPDIWPSACIWTPFLFLIFIYLAVLGLMGSLVVACRLSWPIALGKCKANSQPLDLQGSPGWDFLACKTHSSSFQSFIFFTYRCISQLTRWFASRFSVLILRISNVDVLQSTEGSTSRKSFFYHIICTFYKHMQWTTNQLYL